MDDADGRADLRGRVGAALEAFLARQREVLDDVDPSTVALLDAAEALLLAGGKRLRPSFCWWGARGAGADDDDRLLRAAAALELVHACALVHDDVMDASDTRRGLPTAHRRFAAQHRGEGWTGDAEQFGRSAAVLVGDLCLVWADEMLGGSGVGDAALTRARPVYDGMRTELMAGQHLDLLEQVRGGGTLDSALKVARYKSARYSIERPLALGAALAGAPPEVGEAYAAFGLPLGVAFQLRDDVLGVYGDPSVTGKPAGDDLREGKRTALVALAVEHGDERQRALLRTHLGDPALDADGVEALRAVLRDTGALERTERLVDEHTEQARAALEAAPVTEQARAALADLADAATARTA